MTVFEASDDLGGQWHADGGAQRRLARDAHEHEPRDDRVLRLPRPARPPAAPRGDAVHAYLRAYAERFGVTPRIRLDAPRRRRRGQAGPSTASPSTPSSSRPAASAAHMCPTASTAFAGELLHAFDYPGAEPFRDRATLVYGSGISGLEIASDLAPVALGRVGLPQAALRDPEGRRRRLVGLAVVHALRRARAAPRSRATSSGRRLRERIVRVAGSPRGVRRACTGPRTSSWRGSSLCQDYLAAGRATAASSAAPRSRRSRDRGSCSPTGATAPSTRSSARRATTSTFRSSTPTVRGVLGPELALVPPHAASGPSRSRRPRAVPRAGPVLPAARAPGALARRALGGQRPAARRRGHARRARRAGAAARGAQRARATLAAELGVAPDLVARPELAEPLLFGPLLPPRYRLDGPGARAEAAARFREQLAASPRAPVDPADLRRFAAFGLASVADALGV